VGAAREDRRPGGCDSQRALLPRSRLLPQ
jgi:hypothetical protein